MEIKKVEQLLPKIETKMSEMGLKPEQIKQEALFALQILNNPKNKFLQNATTDSVLTSIVNIAAIGLTLNPVVEEAYIIPRKKKVSKDNWVVEAHLEPSYKGMINLIVKSGLVTNISANVVYSGDYFDCDLGNNMLSHKPYYLNNKQKGDKICAYAIGFLVNGGKQIEIMPMNEIYMIRDTSESYKAEINGKAKTSIWSTYEDEMIRKTLIKRLSKKFPRKQINNNLINALSLTNIDYQVKDWQINKIESLLNTSTILDEQKQEIERQLSSLTYQTANNLIEHLENNQLNPTDRLNMNQGDINKQLDLHCKE